MPKLKNLSLGEWNKMVVTFHEESDRGAGVLAGSFAEHTLGQYLKFHIHDKKVAEALFGPMGPLSTFDQRIAIAYAFELITQTQYKDFETVRKIRNQFAHHPLDTTFNTEEIKQRCTTLSMFKEASESNPPIPGHRHRVAYILTCGILCGRFFEEIETDAAKIRAKKPDA